MTGRFFTAATISVLGFVALPAVAGEAEYNDKAALEISRAAIGRQLADYQFKDGESRPTRLADFRGRPVLINMVYTACSHYCPVTTQSLADGVEAARDALGDDSFSVLTIGFDVRNDKPSRT